MTSPANPFDVPYGYQFQDGDNWDSRPAHVPSDYWIALAADGSRQIVDWTGDGAEPPDTVGPTDFTTATPACLSTMDDMTTGRV